MNAKSRPPRPIEYRPMRQKDVEQILLMECGLFEGTDRLAQRQTQMETYLRYWGSYGHQESSCVVAVRGPEVLGYAIGNRRKQSPSTVSLTRILVKSGHRQQGLGRELLTLFERRAWVLGASMVTASIHPNTSVLLGVERWEIAEPGLALSWQEQPRSDAKRSKLSAKLKKAAVIMTLKPADGKVAAVKDLASRVPLHWFHEQGTGALTELITQRPQIGPDLHCSIILDRLPALLQRIGWESTGKLLLNSNMDGEDTETVHQLWLDFLAANVPDDETVGA